MNQVPTANASSGFRPAWGRSCPFSYSPDTSKFYNSWCYRSGWRTADVAVERLAICAGKYAWSSIVWRGAYSDQRNFLSADYLVLDFDEGEMTLAEAVNAFCDCVHIIGTTRSHQLVKGTKPPRDRFRVVMLLDEQVTDLEVYRATMAYYIDRYDADQSCKDGARFFWPCREIVSVSADGYTQAIHFPKPRKQIDYSSYRAKKEFPRWIEGVLKYGCSENTRNTTSFKLGVHLTKCGFSQSEIVDLIMRSPVPIGPHVRNEVEMAVANGARAAEAEASDQSQEEGA